MSTITYVSSITTPTATYYFTYDHSHAWHVKAQYHGYRHRWVVPKDVADQVMADLVGLVGGAAECTLSIGEATSPTVIHRVIVLNSEPADNLQRRTLVLTDVRYYLELQILSVEVNNRRRTGNVSMVGASLVTQTPAATVTYANYSTNGGAAYDWISFRNQVAAYLGTAKHNRPSITFSMDSFSVIDPTGQTIQHTFLDGMGDDGLARATEAIPGASVYVSLLGVIHIFEKTYGAEITKVSGLEPALQDQGDLQLVNESRRRPNGFYRIYVDYEIEIRFDYDPLGTFGANDPYLIMVLQVTDQTLLIPAGTYPGIGTVAARTVGQGSWISFDEAYAAWAYDRAHGGPQIPSGYPDLSDAVICKHWFDGGLPTFAMGVNLATFQPVWAGRIGAAVAAFSTYFKVNPNFWGRVRHAWDVRAAVWDAATGTRAQAPVYSNYSYEQVMPFAVATQMYYTQSVTTSWNATLTNGNPSGFECKILDQEAGIIHIIRNIDKMAQWASDVNPRPVTTPAAITNDTVMKKELSNQALDTTWQLSVILSVSPGSPNDLRRFYEVKSTAAAAMVSIGASPVLVANSYGPDIEMRTQLAQARVAWQDSLRADILSLLGTADSSPAITTADPVTTVGPINPLDELIPLANALAATDCLTKLDHYEGQRACKFDATLAPIGTLDEVIHKVDADRLVSVVRCAPIPPPFRAEEFLKGSARKFLLKEIAQGER